MNIYTALYKEHSALQKGKTQWGTTNEERTYKQTKQNKAGY